MRAAVMLLALAASPVMGQDAEPVVVQFDDNGEPVRPSGQQEAAAEQDPFDFGAGLAEEYAAQNGPGDADDDPPASRWGGTVTFGGSGSEGTRTFNRVDTSAREEEPVAEDSRFASETRSECVDTENGRTCSSSVSFGNSEEARESSRALLESMRDDDD